MGARTCQHLVLQVLAEKAAWELAKQGGLDLVVLLPSQILGLVVPTAPSYSVNAMKVQSSIE